MTCLRDAGLGIADLREFTRLLRANGEPGDRVAFLRQRRAMLRERVVKIRTAIGVLDEKIEYFAEGNS